MELLLEEVGCEEDSVGEVWWTKWTACENQDCWNTKGLQQSLWKWAGRLKVARIMLSAPLETGPCMRQHSIICPLVTYGGVCTQPALQVSVRHSDSAEESIRFSRVFPHCTGGGTAEEQNLLLANHLTYVSQPRLAVVLLCQGGTNTYPPCAERTNHRGSRTGKPDTKLPSSPGFHQTFLGP